MQTRTWTTVAVAAAAALTACRAGFRVSRYSSSPGLYQASLKEFQKKKWDNAILGFEKLTNDLGPRDTLLPRSYWYLATSHVKNKENLLAAQSYTRLYESFPDDSLADDAVLEAARSYKRMWRKPTLDATYGETALSAYNTLLGLYGNSELADAAKQEIQELEEWFATKNFETGRYYARRKAYDSAIIYLKTVLERWPNVPRARDALLLLADVYKVLKYREELNEVCTTLRREHATDAQASKSCVGVPVVADSATKSAAIRPPGRD